MAGVNKLDNHPVSRPGVSRIEQTLESGKKIGGETWKARTNHHTFHSTVRGRYRAIARRSQGYANEG